MISNQIKNPKIIFSYTKPPISHLFYSYTQIQTYVDVYMKWKKDPQFDSIDSIHKSLELKPIISIKNHFISSPHENYSIPISEISKKGSDFDISIKVARFLRNYPSIFEEFKGPLYNLPWFRLTQKAIELDQEEKLVCEQYKEEILERLKKLILLTGNKKALPLKVIKGFQWYLGLNDDFWRDPLRYIGDYGCFEVVEMEDKIKGLAVIEKDTKIISTMQKNAMKSGVYNGDANESIAFPLFPSKGLRLKHKIKDWLVEFQKIPYVSPYDDYSFLNPDSDLSEKRVVGLLHEMLSLFVEHSAERKAFLCLRKHMGLPQKVHKAFERHPYMFYLSLKNRTCTAILKEAYCDEGAIEAHPLAEVRKKYIDLVKESKVLLRVMRGGNRKDFDQENVEFKGSDSKDAERCLMTEF